MHQCLQEPPAVFQGRTNSSLSVTKPASPGTNRLLFSLSFSLSFFLHSPSPPFPYPQFIKEDAFENGIQTVTIPTTGAWRITAYGARGGYAHEDASKFSCVLPLPPVLVSHSGGARAHSHSPLHCPGIEYTEYQPGRGARVYGVVHFQANQKVKVVVGQSGRQRFNTGGGSYGGGGGGGTFVYLDGDSEPLFVAGGGGGASYYSNSYAYFGRHGTAGRCGTKGGSSGYNGDPGCNGYGGIEGRVCNSGSGGGGAGWRQNGRTTCGYQTFGISKSGNFVGGHAMNNGYKQGGFGGGAGTQHEGGGGGGYSGGGGGYHYAGGGGGGGSYFSGISSGAEAGGSYSDHGYVVFEYASEFADVSPITEISTCGALGRTGPIASQCNGVYNSVRDPNGWYRGVTNGIQRLGVPKSGFYRLTAGGAKGGDGERGHPDYAGGLGATVSGVFYLEKDEIINVVVGQNGQYRSNADTTASIGGGGGGGTFVWKESVCALTSTEPCLPLLVAGGGGGGSYSSSYRGQEGRAEQAGTAALGYGGDGGVGGYGGFAPYQDSGGLGGGGAGWRGPGTCFYTYGARCGQSMAGNFVGGFHGANYYCEGGFGGGAATQHEGGGGGGFSGGGGGYHTYGGGGGGGSYISGYQSTWTSGTNIAGEGYLTIENIPDERVVNKTTVVFTTCGAEGRMGPTTSQCRNIYGNTNTIAGSMLISVVSGVQRVRIPTTGLYMIRAEGARGGDAYLPSESSYHYWGAQGAVSWGLFHLEAGQILNLVVGQPGSHRSTVGGGSWGGGGGGGSFVWKEGSNVPLIVAGGGGGASYYNQDTRYSGQPGEASMNGGRSASNGGAGGTNGNGGVSVQNSVNRGGAGGGWYSDGDCATYFTSLCGHGKAKLFTGGYNTYNYGYYEGGFGGGGGTQHEGGGGGGYSGVLLGFEADWNLLFLSTTFLSLYFVLRRWRWLPRQRWWWWRRLVPIWHCQRLAEGRRCGHLRRPHQYCGSHANTGRHVCHYMWCTGPPRPVADTVHERVPGRRDRSLASRRAQRHPAI